MNFTITGTVKLIKEMQSGTSSTGSEWQKREFLIKTTDEYDNEFCFTLFGDKANTPLEIGRDVTVHFNIKTNEWQGKHYTGLDAWKIEPVGAEVNAPY